ncbi:PH and SEC7 domain-containing protein 4-like [Acipenser ruthenus]|uniref:PH and SEC7 domain-containing protein 4-like n=1 Tax=Acipenser ruthenus TaxID=7906 RepID=UPI00274085C1|nr:PH and SEC7 domain-containing protein 4-like [Acipenser ruthenus]
MLLNTDLHGQNLGKAMSCSGFISNLDGMNEGGNFPRELLKSLYSSIKNEKLEWAVADSELQDSLLPPGGERGDCGSLRSKSNPFQDLAHDQQAPQFKQGFLTRKAHARHRRKEEWPGPGPGLKACADIVINNGSVFLPLSQLPGGRRSWKVFYAVLKGMVLYLQKSDSLVQCPLSEEVVSVCRVSYPSLSPPLSQSESLVQCPLSEEVVSVCRVSYPSLSPPLSQSESLVQCPLSEEVVSVWRVSNPCLSPPLSQSESLVQWPRLEEVVSVWRSDSLVQWPRSEEVVSVHHALAERAVGYTKRPNVFRLQTADWRVFLFQAQSSEEMLSWVCRINLVAALFSSPPFPAAVGSQRRFVRPILPASCSSNCQEDQLEAHKRWLESFSQDLAEHQQNQPERGRGRAREQEEYRLREEYLQHETMRYDSYVKLLQARLRLGSDDLARFEALVCEGLEGDAGTLTKSHSSPSLNQDSETPVVRVKRNISERRTYRRIIVPRRSREQL